MQNKNGMVFVRYGGLSPVKQQGFVSHPNKQTFHSPPARSGLYAFPQFWVEHFLLGGDINSFGVKNRIVRLKDKNGELITNRHPLFDKLSSRGNKYWDRTDGKLWPGSTPNEHGEYQYKDYIHYLTTNQKPKKFIHKGNIWHHLESQILNGEVLKSHGSWILTSMDIYKKAFAKEMNTRRKDAMRDLGKWDPDTEIKDANFLPRNPYKWHTKDSLEVFIERIQS